MSTEAYWYLARGSGTVSLLLLTAVLVLGIATWRGRPLPGLSRLAVASVHRSISLLAVVFLGVHLVTLLADPYAQLNLVDLVVPFGGGYRPLFTGLGTLAFDLMIALVATSLLRHRLPYRAWKALHLSAYALWPVALLHGVGSGTDAATGWMIGLDVLCVAAVGAALLLRGRPARPLPPRPRSRATSDRAVSPHTRTTRTPELQR